MDRNPLIDMLIINKITFKGSIGKRGNITKLPNTTAKIGWAYIVATAGTYGGQVCEVGDIIVASSDGSPENEATWILL